MRSVAALALLAGSALPAQAQAPPVPASTVTGHVTLADTGGPARMASVTLEPAEELDAAGAPASKDKVVRSIGVHTRLDGSYTFEHVAPGTYYVLATSPGYLSPLAALGWSFAQLDLLDSELRTRLRQHLVRVTVSSAAGGTADLTLERGAAVSGTVLYDDGNPAVDLPMYALIHRKGKWVQPEEQASRTSTDDRGQFRLSGLPPGEYLLSVHLDTDTFGVQRSNGANVGMYSSGRTSLTLYSGKAARPQDAEPFPLKPGEERAGEDLSVPLSKLHSVSGMLQAARDGHVLNGGEISLVFPDTKEEVTKVRMEHGDETFTLDYVLEGDYLLQVHSAGDFTYAEVPTCEGCMPPTRTEEHNLHWYGTAEQPLHVGAGDVSGLAVSVPEKAPKASASAAP